VHWLQQGPPEGRAAARYEANSDADQPWCMCPFGQAFGIEYARSLSKIEDHAQQGNGMPRVDRAA
jgi:hypothetical protein